MLITYQIFVDQIVNSLLCDYPSVNPYRLFPNPHMLDKKEAICAEYAYLSDQYAECFYRMVQRYADYLKIDADEYCPKQKHGLPIQNIKSDDGYAFRTSALSEKRLKYEHSCYQKNLYRWARGTVSRKKKCRVEFVLIAACWAAGWDKKTEDRVAADGCRNAIQLVCREILKAGSIPAEQYEGSDLVRMLWMASNMAAGYEKKS